jgi:hypothetical protein
VNSQSMLIRAGDVAFYSHASLGRAVLVPLTPSPAMRGRVGVGASVTAKMPPSYPSPARGGREKKYMEARS